MMELSGLHLLLTFQCTLECDHCFVWGSPWQTGVMTLAQVEEILAQGQAARTVNSIYFEGGEPFLYYPLLVQAVRAAARRGFGVGVVSNGYWATTREDAIEWLRPFAGVISDLSISSDLYHWSEQQDRHAANAAAAARELDIPVGTIAVAQPESVSARSSSGQLPPGESGVMYRGRAAVELIARAAREPWDRLDDCPHEDLREPGRVHIDPLGNLHLCQGIVLGNLFATPLAAICERYEPDAHEIVGPLLRGGPAELARHWNVPHAEAYADACHLCYSTRLALRDRFPEILKPDQVYGVGLE